MRISIGSDHRGLEVKNRLTELLGRLGHHVSDEGTHTSDSVDYPDIASTVAAKVSHGQVDRGILICGTGIGMSITANKFPGVRAATCNDAVTAEISRRHNDVNVLCLAGDLLGQRNIDRLIEIWIDTKFEGGRHARRLEKISQIEHETP
ncbi:MAG: ribose 5-phosphate isomerase B [Pirellulaceae bacterium]